MSDQVHQLLTALREPKLTEKLRKWCEDVTQSALDFYAGNIGDAKGKWDESIDDAEYLNGYLRDLFSGLPYPSHPSIIGSGDLCDAFRVYLPEGIGFAGDFDDVYGHFLDFIEHRLLAMRRSGLFSLCSVNVEGLASHAELKSHADTVKVMMIILAHQKAQILGTNPEIAPPLDSNEGGGEREDQPIDGLVLWSANGISLVCDHIAFETAPRGEFRLPEPDSHCGTLYAHLEGRATPDALAYLEKELQPLLPVIFGIERTVHGDFDLEHFWKSLPFVRACCNMLLEAPTKKDTTFQRRIANAIRFLAEGAGQRNDAIRTALSVTALEALLGRKSDEIGSQLANSVAVLLEPRLDGRAGVVKLVKELYNERSRVLHGDSLEAALGSTAQILCAGVLWGLWFRHDFLTRLGEKPGSPEELLNKLRDRTWESGLPDGLPDLPRIRALWRGEEPKENIMQ